jgi:hypothetical protein
VQLLPGSARPRWRNSKRIGSRKAVVSSTSSPPNVTQAIPPASPRTANRAAIKKPPWNAAKTTSRGFESRRVHSPFSGVATQRTRARSSVGRALFSPRLSRQKDVAWASCPCPKNKAAARMSAGSTLVQLQSPRLRAPGAKPCRKAPFGPSCHARGMGIPSMVDAKLWHRHPAHDRWPGPNGQGIVDSRFWFSL